MADYEGKDEGLDISFDFHDDMAGIHSGFANDVCINVFKNFTEEEIKREEVVFQECWCAGEKLVKSQQNIERIYTTWFGDINK